MSPQEAKAVGVKSSGTRYRRKKLNEIKTGRSDMNKSRQSLPEMLLEKLGIRTEVALGVAEATWES